MEKSRVVHLEGKLRKAESELQKSVDSARVLKDEAKRLARSLETREDKISALHNTVRTLHKEARAKERESEAQEVAAVNADHSSSLEGELRKRAAMVSSQVARGHSAILPPQFLVVWGIPV